MGSLGRYQNPANGQPASKLPKTNLLEDTEKMKSLPTIHSHCQHRRRQLGLIFDGPHSRNRRVGRGCFSAKDLAIAATFIVLITALMLLAALSN